MYALRVLSGSVVAGAVLLLLLVAAGGGATAAAPHPALANVLEIDQTSQIVETGNFTVSMEVASAADISFAFFTFCQLSSPVCYSPVAMTHQSGDWYAGTTKPMTSYPGMTVGVQAGYNITIDYTNGTNQTEPQFPNQFTNLTVATEVTGEFLFEMTVSPSSYGLSGVVINAVTNVGIPGATVTLSAGNTTPVTTNASGGYTIGGVPNGNYTLSVSDSGYLTSNQSVEIANGNAVANVPLYTPGSGGPPPQGGHSSSSGINAWFGGHGDLAVGGVVIALLVVAAGLLLWRRRATRPAPSSESSGSAGASGTGTSGDVGGGRKRAGWIAAILVVVVLVVGGGVAYADHVIPTPGAKSSAQTMAPGFTLATIYGQNFSLSEYRNSSAVVIEFTSLSCAECQIVEKSLASLYSGYNQTGDTRAYFISIFIEPQYGDTIPALKSYHESHNVTWTMAQDTNSLAVSRAYGVEDIPTVVVVDPKGQVVYDVSGVQNANTLQTTINSALAGTAQAISIVTVSVFALAAIAGVTTFFSPCAFPMFPGYMGLFLGLNAGQAGAGPNAKGAYKGAARRAAIAGSVTALGMILVFLLVGLALILAASVVSGYIPDLLIGVGVVLIALGGLLLTNLQYWRIVTPLQSLWYRMGGKRPEENLSSPSSPSGKGFHLKLFGYGMGYAAAAAGCVFPVIFSSIVAGLALGLLGGILNIVIFSATAAVLMIVVTVMLALAGQKWVNQLKALTPVIKKVSAVALIIVGVYLIYFFYTAWVV